MWLHVFSVPDSMLLIIVQSTNDFNLLALWKNRGGVTPEAEAA